MDYANNLKIIHRDLKPANILINEENVIKIADFGFAKIVKDAAKLNYMTKAIGSTFYMAPEVFSGKAYNSKCDVWSVGIMIYELLYGVSPFENDNSSKNSSENSSKNSENSSKISINFNDVDFFKKIEENKEKDLFFPKNSKKIKISEEFKDLLGKMLKVDVEKRIDWKEVKEHQVLRGIGNIRAKMFIKNKLVEISRILIEKKENFPVKNYQIFRVLFLLIKLVGILINLNEGKSHNFVKNKEILEFIYSFIENQEKKTENQENREKSLFFSVFDLKLDEFALNLKFIEAFKYFIDEFLLETTSRKLKKEMNTFLMDLQIKEVIYWLVYLRDLKQIDNKKEEIISEEIKNMKNKALNELFVLEGKK